MSQRFFNDVDADVTQPSHIPGSGETMPEVAARLAPDALPIVVDLDNTLVVTDTLHEQVVRCVLTKPVGLFRVTSHVLKGRAAVKAALAHEVDLATTTLPLRTELIEWLRGEAQRGREIHLCSAAHQSVVDTIAERIGFFVTAVGSRAVNLKGQAKADYLVERFPEGFVYAGDSRDDLPVWKAAKRIVLAGAPLAVASAAHSLGKPIEAEFSGSPLTFKDGFKALRAHHWAKNALILVPLILGHAWTNNAIVIKTLLGLVCLLAVTSATYLINDVADLQADRRHWSKCNRALAAGRLPISVGVLIAGLLLAAGFASAFLLSLKFALTLAGYLALTLSYSFGLKRVPLLDVLIVGTLFTSRLAMGIALAGQTYSEWLLTFSMFFFFSLAVAKRHTEIVRAKASASNSLKSRGYQIDDAPLTLVFGVASSVASLLIIMLFIVEEVQRRNMYSHPKALWAIPAALALWISRIWLLAHRGKMNDDPVSFALRDKASLALGAAVIAIFMVAV